MPVVESAWHPVEVVLDVCEPQRVEVKGGAFEKPSSEQPVGVLVGRVLPWAVGIAEDHLDAARVLDVGSAGHLASLVPGQGAHEMGGLAGERRGDGPGDMGRPVAGLSNLDSPAACDETINTARDLEPLSNCRIFVFGHVKPQVRGLRQSPKSDKSAVS